jgi:hypothetical protein
MLLVVEQFDAEERRGGPYLFSIGAPKDWQASSQQDLPFPVPDNCLAPAEPSCQLALGYTQGGSCQGTRILEPATMLTP